MASKKITKKGLRLKRVELVLRGRYFMQKCRRALPVLVHKSLIRVNLKTKARREYFSFC